VPDDFRFSVKAPKHITHELQLRNGEPDLDAFLAEVAPLGNKLGCLLFQLPPRLEFERATVQRFFEALRERYSGAAVAEPRNVTWFGSEAASLLATFEIGLVAADPSPLADAKQPSRRQEVNYFRLHGSPRMYYSSYPPAYLKKLADRMSAAARNARSIWCIFDNTASGAAADNALALSRILKETRAPSRSDKPSSVA